MRQSEEGVIREALIFHGRVQGVGFRYTLRHMADTYGVTGWVRNESDGTVSAQWQGRKPILDRILEEIREDRYIRVEEVERQRIPTDSQERDFKIRRDWF